MSELNAGRFPLCAGDFDEAVRDAMTCNNDQRWYKYFVAHDAALRARVAELEQAETERIEWVQRAEQAEAMNEALREQLAAHSLTWTTTRPKVAGWYWFRNQDLKVWPDLGPVIVPVVLLPTTNELTILWASTNQPVCEYNGADEWAGPIAEPKETT